MGMMAVCSREDLYCEMGIGDTVRSTRLYIE